MTDKLNLSLTLGSVALGILLYLLPQKTPFIVLLCIVVMFGLLAYPVWNLPWIDGSLGRKIGALIALAGFLVIVGDVCWPRVEHTKLDDSKAHTPTSPQTKSLHDLFISDHKGTATIRGARVLSSSKNIEKVYTVEFIVCGDFEIKSEYLSLFLPKSDHTLAACRLIPGLYQSILSDQPIQGLLPAIVAPAPGEREESWAELKPSGRIFIYHETYLVPSRIDELTQEYIKAGLSPQFRGRDYLIMKNSPLYGDESRAINAPTDQNGLSFRNYTEMNFFKNHGKSLLERGGRGLTDEVRRDVSVWETKVAANLSVMVGEIESKDFLKNTDIEVYDLAGAVRKPPDRDFLNILHTRIIRLDRVLKEYALRHPF